MVNMGDVLDIALLQLVLQSTGVKQVKRKMDRVACFLIRFAPARMPY